MHFFFIIFLLALNSLQAAASPEKVLICGVGKNIAPTMLNTIKNAEALGHQFADYAILIYENNSTDLTKDHLKLWATMNRRVIVKCEDVPEDQLPKSRTEKIARARNIVLNMAKRPKYRDFKYLIMVDLDFKAAWPIAAILETLKQPMDWDCVSSNGRNQDHYYDRYAFRDSRFPFGPEITGQEFWAQHKKTGFSLSGKEWVPAYSAFGGLAIYKTAAITQFAYSGSVTDDLQHYYQHIIRSLSPSNAELQFYLKSLNMSETTDLSLVPVVFQMNTQWEQVEGGNTITCCEHVPLHAAMFMHGYGKFYINPTMIMDIR